MFHSTPSLVLFLISLPTESEGFAVVEMDTRIDKTEDFDINEIWLDVNKYLAIQETDTVVLILDLYNNVNTTDENYDGSGFVEVFDPVLNITISVPVDSVRQRQLQRLDDGTEEAEMLRNKLISIVGPPLEAKYREMYPDTFREVVLTVEMLGEKDGKVAFRFFCSVMFIPPDEIAETFEPPSVEELNNELDGAVDADAIMVAIMEEAEATPELEALQNVAGTEVIIVEASVPSETVAKSALSAAPSASPSGEPSAMPSAAPTPLPSSTPSDAPSGIPSSSPSLLPSSEPSIEPTSLPSVTASDSPSSLPSALPSLSPSSGPSAAPSAAPSLGPSISPSGEPTTLEPTVSNAPSHAFEPSDSPSISLSPSSAPSTGPSTPNPTATQSDSPSLVPSISPSAGKLTFTMRSFPLSFPFF